MYKNNKYLKVMFGNTSGANINLNYKIDEVNVADSWNPNANSPQEMGGFIFSTEDNILRWLVRGDTLYDVIIPNDAEVINCKNLSTPNGVFRTNKIILSNPRKVTDEVAMNLYQKSNLPEKTYYKALAGLAIRGHINTSKQLIRDRINKNNIKEVLDEINDFIKPEHSNGNGNTEVYKEIREILEEIDSDLLISINCDKEPYIKGLTNDKVINLTGESGSGKSYYSSKYINDDNYIVIDTDIIFGDRPSDNKESLEIRELFKNRQREDIITDFDNCYLEILDYFKDSGKTIVIDSAQFRNIKDYSLLKGKIIIMRTCIDNCYERCINRWKNIKNNNFSPDELEQYTIKKSKMYNWYKGLNKFIINIAKL